MFVIDMRYGRAVVGEPWCYGPPIRKIEGRYLIGVARLPVRAIGAEMQRHRWALSLLAGALGALAMTGGTGLAQAQPDSSQPVVPSIIEQLITSTPALSVDPSDDGGLPSQRGGVGMICQNLMVRCR